MIALDAPPPDAPAPRVDVFFDALARDGHWEELAPYGRLWSPSDPRYEPYRNGHWQWTDYGWTWLADESFGWAVNHYGRWLLLDGRWLWKPDVQWGPSQVDWRSGGDYVGWAPAVPAGAQPIPGPHWKFILARDLGRVDLVSLYVSIDVSVAYAASQPLDRYTRTTSGEVFITGPDPAELQQRYGTEIVAMPLPTAITGRFQPAVWLDPGQIEDQRHQGELAWRQVTDEQQGWQDEQRRIAREQQAIDTERRQLAVGGAADRRPLAAQQRALDERQRRIELARQANLARTQRFRSEQLRRRDEQRGAARQHAPDPRYPSGRSVGRPPWSRPSRPQPPPPGQPPGPPHLAPTAPPVVPVPGEQTRNGHREPPRPQPLHVQPPGPAPRYPQPMHPQPPHLQPPHLQPPRLQPPHPLPAHPPPRPLPPRPQPLRPPPPRP